MNISSFLSELEAQIKPQIRFGFTQWVGKDELYFDLVRKDGVRKQFTLKNVSDKLTTAYSKTLNNLTEGILG